MILSLVACLTTTTTTATTASTPGFEEPGPPPPPSHADELHALEGVSADEISRRFGPPTSSRSFTMAECCSEFSIELYNTYRPDDPSTAAVEIQQRDYDYDGYTMTLWLHAPQGSWVVLETSRYGDDVEF